MNLHEMTPAETAAAIHRANVTGACPVRIMVDGKDVKATVVNVTGNALGVILWAES